MTKFISEKSKRTISSPVLHSLRLNSIVVSDGRLDKFTSAVPLISLTVEYSSNKRGGRWLINLDKKQRGSCLDNFWLEVVNIYLYRAGETKYLISVWQTDQTIESRIFCFNSEYLSPQGRVMAGLNIRKPSM